MELGAMKSRSAVMPFWKAAWTSRSSLARWACARATGSILDFLAITLSSMLGGISLELPLQVGLWCRAFPLGYDVGCQVVEILQLLSGGSVWVVGVVVE